jgi:LysR family transcriptional regulator, glycine cleavage system transcriptional activator
MVARTSFPSLASIRAFEAAARLGGFAAAARELGVSAVSVGYHVRQLERQLGVALFRRLPHRVELTGPGAIVARDATSAFDALRASFARAIELDDTRLSLTALPTFGTSWLTPRLGRFRARRPAIHIDLDLSSSAQDLTDGRFDAAIRNGDGRWPGLRGVALFQSLFMPLCAPALLSEVGRLTEAAPSVALLGRPDWWALWRRAAGCAQSLRPEDFAVTLAEEHLDAAAAMAGHGVTIGSPILFAAEIAAGRLVPAHDLVASDGRAFWLAYPHNRRRVSKIAELEVWLCEEAQAAREAAAPLLRRMITLA